MSLRLQFWSCVCFAIFCFNQENSIAEVQDLEQIVQETNAVETEASSLLLSGYVDAGYLYNFSGGGSVVASRGFTSDGISGGDFNINQIKLALEKPLTDKDEIHAGFRVDAMLGEDAQDFGGNVGAAGLVSDSLYLQQAYLQLHFPVGNGLDVIAGRWGALIGYEPDERADNLHITIGANALIDPAPNTGVAVFYTANDWIDFGLGISNGSGSSTGVGLDAANDEYAVTGIVNINSGAENANLQTGFHYAPNGDTGYGTENETVLIWNTFGNWAPLAMEDKLLLAFNTSLGVFDDFSVPGDNGSMFWTGALYAKYFINDHLSLAGRAEYVHTDDSQFLFGNPALGQNDIWSWTSTLGVHLFEDVLIRFEYRIDWGNDVQQNGAGFGTHDSAHTVATQVVYQF